VTAYRVTEGLVVLAAAFLVIQLAFGRRRGSWLSSRSASWVRWLLLTVPTFFWVVATGNARGIVVVGPCVLFLAVAAYRAPRDGW
jgi:multisubunit Na+/H+ antiporter MnhB subunit